MKIRTTAWLVGSAIGTLIGIGVFLPPSPKAHATSGPQIWEDTSRGVTCYILRDSRTLALDDTDSLAISCVKTK